MARDCEICGRRALCVCSACGATICEKCIDFSSWNCIDCQKGEGRKFIGFPWGAPFTLFLLGFLLIFTGMITLFLAAVMTATAPSGGAIFLIGPIPVILGAGPLAAWIVILAAILTIVAILLMFFLARRLV